MAGSLALWVTVTLATRSDIRESRLRDVCKRPSCNQFPVTASDQLAPPHYITLDNGLEPSVRFTPFVCDTIWSIDCDGDFAARCSSAIAVKRDDGVPKFDAIDVTWPIGSTCAIAHRQYVSQRCQGVDMPVEHADARRMKMNFYRRKRYEGASQHQHNVNLRCFKDHILGAVSVEMNVDRYRQPSKIKILIDGRSVPL